MDEISRFSYIFLDLRLLSLKYAIIISRRRIETLKLLLTFLVFSNLSRTYVIGAGGADCVNLLLG